MTVSLAPRCAIAALALGLAGCASYKPEPLTAEEGARRLAARTLDSPELARFVKGLRPDPPAWPPASWDAETLTYAAWYYHPDMAAARAELAAARADAAVARERPEPVLSLGPQYTASNPEGLGSPWTWGYALDWTVETAGKRAKRVEASNAAVDAARLRLDEAAWKVRSRLRASLLSLWADRRRESLLRKSADDRRAYAALLEARFAAGEIGLAEVMPARVASAQAQAAELEARGLDRAALAQVAAATGLSVGSIESVPLDFRAFAGSPRPAPSLDALRRRALLGRPDVLASLSDYAAADAGLRLEIAKQYPDIDLGPGYQWDQGAVRYQLGIGLTLPLNRNRGGIARATAARETAAVRFLALQASILGQVEGAAAEYAAARESLSAADALADRQRAQAEAESTLFRAGEADRADELSAAALEDEAEVARLDAAARAQTALGALEDSVERPLDGPAPAPGGPFLR